MLHTIRLLVAALGGLLLAVGILGPVSVGQPTWYGIYFIALGVGAIAIAVLEKVRYQAHGTTAGAGRERPTDEVFIDPATGQQTRVWIDPASGERAYLPEGDRPQK